MAYLLAAVLFTQNGLPQGIPFAAPADPMRIVAINVSSQTPLRGSMVSATVLTTSNVAAATAQVGTLRINLDKVAPGTFQTRVQVPWWAPTGPMSVTITAIRADGATTSTSLAVVVR